MNKLLHLKASLVIATILALPAAHAATMTKAEFNAGGTRISADYEVDKTACAALAGNAKSICREEASAKEKVARAELQFAYTTKPGDENKMLVARAESAYAVAKQRCDDKAGNVKDVCVVEAKSVKTKALANAKMGKQIGEARKEGAQTKRDADYKVASEKCDALSGDTKATCIADAKAAFDKS